MNESPPKHITKTTGSCVRRIAALLFFLLLGLLPSFSETLVVSDGATNSIVVASNEAIIVDFIDSNSHYPIHRRAGNSYLIEVTEGSAFAGPCEIIFFNYSAVVTFRRIQTTAINTVVLGANETNVIVVQSNKTLRIFPVQGLLGGVLISRGMNSHAFWNESLMRGCELTGPLSVTMTGHSSSFLGQEYRQVFTYCLTEDFLQVTADGYLKGPAGAFEVVVEKSTDLNRWSPAMIQSTATADTAAYYRLRIQK